MAEQSCETRITRSLESTLANLRAMFEPDRNMVELVDDGTLDTVLRIGEEEFRFSDTAEYRACETAISTWFERDRAHVALTTDDGQTTIIEWWDDDVQAAVDDGFLDPSDWHGSAVEHAESIGIMPAGSLDLDALLDDEFDTMADTMRERLYEYGLSFDYVAPETFTDQDQGYFRYQLSWGGPSTEFRFYVNPGFTCYRVEYWFLDWNDGASRSLHGDDKRLLLAIFEEFREIGSVEHEYNAAIEC